MVWVSVVEPILVTPFRVELMPHCGIRTAVACPGFKMLQPDMTPHTYLATQAISNWNQIVEFLKQIATLQAPTTPRG